MKLSIRVGIILCLVTLVFGGAAFALVYHINDAAEAAKKEYAAEVSAYFNERDEKIKHDVENLTVTEIERLKSETSQYLHEKMNADYQKQLNQTSDEVTRVTNQKIKELKDYIDQLISEGNE
ncbi:hypothetical protein HUN92_17480 [Bacillus firmus]|uniref:hypothetical protein n=1 Tax=Cytobacillus firmus TaxID=1399 RepID=UPI0015801180|nr:hypothetical protein [Cytobacillus firmus]NUH85489.1 hypothetical protein [Cytobacillus firmus]